MTDRKNITELAQKVGAQIVERNGRISRIEWAGGSYGDGALFSLVCFAERARKA